MEKVKKILIFLFLCPLISFAQTATFFFVRQAENQNQPYSPFVLSQGSEVTVPTKSWDGVSWFAGEPMTCLWGAEGLYSMLYFGGNWSEAFLVSGNGSYTVYFPYFSSDFLVTVTDYSGSSSEGWTMNPSISPALGGDINPGLGVYSYDASHSFSAVPNAGYAFRHWNASTLGISTYGVNPININVSSVSGIDFVTLEAVFGIDSNGDGVADEDASSNVDTDDDVPAINDLRDVLHGDLQSILSELSSFHSDNNQHMTDLKSLLEQISGKLNGGQGGTVSEPDLDDVVYPELDTHTEINPTSNDVNNAPFVQDVFSKVNDLKNSSPGVSEDMVISMSTLHPALEDWRLNWAGMYPALETLRLTVRTAFVVFVYCFGALHWFRIVGSLFS